MKADEFRIPGALIALCCLPHAAFAQAAPPVAQSDVSTTAATQSSREATGQVEDIVVTARKTAENIQRVPIAITAITPEVLERKNIQLVSDLQGLAPSLFLISGNGGSAALSLSIRGITSPEPSLAQDPTVGIYLDGVVLPSNIGLNSSLYDLEQVEVLNGPQGTLFGKNSTSGALQITTRKPTWDWNGFAEFSYGNYDSHVETGAVGGPIVTDVVAFRLAAQISDHDGYGTNLTGDPLNDLHSRSVRGQLLVKFNEDTTLLLSGDYTSIRNHGLNSLVSYLAPLASASKVAIETAAELGLSPSSSAANQAAGYAAFAAAAFCGRGFHDSCSNFRQIDNNEVYGFAGTFDTDFGFAKLKAITALRYLSRDNFNDYDGSKFNILAPDKLTTAHQFTGELQLSNATGRFDWVVGALYGRLTGNDNSTTVQLPLINPASPSYTVNALTNVTKAVYGQGNLAVTDTLHVTGGLRYTSDERKGALFNYTGAGCTVPIALRPSASQCETTLHRNSDNVSWLGSIDWQVVPTILAYVKATRGYRAGGVPTTGTTAATFVTFGPETITEYEGGIKTDLFNRRVRINADVFYDDYKGLQRNAIVNTSAAIVNVVTNAATARIYGVELAGTAYVTPHWDIGGNFAYINAAYKSFIDLTGNRSSEPFPQPKYTFALNTDYTVPVSVGSIKFSADYRWQSSVVLRPTAVNRASETQSSYGLLGARVALDIADMGLELSMWVKNALNKDFLSGGLDLDSSLGYNLVYTGTPRTFAFEIKKTF